MGARLPPLPTPAPHLPAQLRRRLVHHRPRLRRQRRRFLMPESEPSGTNVDPGWSDADRSQDFDQLVEALDYFQTWQAVTRARSLIYRQLCPAPGRPFSMPAAAAASTWPPSPLALNTAVSSA